MEVSVESFRQGRGQSSPSGRSERVQKRIVQPLEYSQIPSGALVPSKAIGDAEGYYSSFAELASPLLEFFKLVIPSLIGPSGARHDQ